MTKTTTTKIPGPMHDRLLRAAKKTGLKKSLLLRLCVEAGLPQVVTKIAALGEVGREVAGVGLVLAEQEQLDELRGLYRSAVTDLVPAKAGVEGKEFVAEVERLLPPLKLKAEEEGRVRRFLAVYAQLF